MCQHPWALQWAASSGDQCCPPCFDLAAPVLRSVRKAHRPLDESSERWRDGFVFDERRIKTGFAQIVDGAKIEPAIGIYHARCSLNR